MGTERGGCSRLMKTPRHNGGAVHSRSMKAKTMTVAAVGTEQAGLTNNGSWRDGESVMRWWVGDDPNQMTLEDYFKNVGIDWE